MGETADMFTSSCVELEPLIIHLKDIHENQVYFVYIYVTKIFVLYA